MKVNSNASSGSGIPYETKPFLSVSQEAGGGCVGGLCVEGGVQVLDLNQKKSLLASLLGVIRP